MNDTLTLNETTEQAKPYSSIHELRAVNTYLLDQLSKDPKNPYLLIEVEAFIARGKATGALLDADQDRWDSQRMLDYWATMLYRAQYRPGLEPINATLAPFQEEHAKKLDDNLCPYIGLDAFQEQDANNFFGRTQLIEQMIERLRLNRFLAVVGPSGSGKSSVVRAGILPKLKSGALPGSQSWNYFPKPMVPGSEPLANLARLVNLSDDASQELIKSNEESFRKDPGHLLKLLDSFDQKPSVLVIDQFEEVFTLCESTETRKALTDNLLEVIRSPNSSHLIILTMRIDYETFVTRLKEFYPYFHKAEERVPPLTASELRQAIEAPAENVDLEFEDGVVENLLQDILGEPAALPLLQFTLRELWNRRRFNRVTMEAYQDLGGGRLALARTADAIFNDLPPQEQSVMKAILLRMVRPGVGLEVTSNRVRRESLFQDYPADRVKHVLDRLISARLIRLTPGDSPADDQVEVAHEALVRNWPTLVEWLDNDRPAIIRRRQLEGKALEWIRLGRGTSGLLDVVQLAEAKQWLASPDASRLGYHPALPDLIRASENALSKEKGKLYAWIAALVVLLLLTATAAGVLIWKWRQAETYLSEYRKAEENLKEKALQLNTQRSKAEPEHPTISESSPEEIKRWPNGSVLRVRFMDGKPIVQEKVKQYANEWTKYANIRFDFVSNGHADIRISFRNAGSWSALGTTALDVPADEPTMNFGWLTPDTPDAEYSQVVLHQFGHALGLIEEHQNPNAHLPWNKEKVYAYLTGPPNYWDKEQVDYEIFKKYNFKDYREFDPKSVMMYAFPRELFTTDFETGINTVLSDSDKSFIAKLYPGNLSAR